jgi:hypothetical protein
MATAMSIVIILPRTADGRALLRETLRSIKSADTRLSSPSNSIGTSRQSRWSNSD